MGSLELRPFAKPERDVEKALVRDPMPLRPGFAARLGVLDELDQCVVCPQRERLSLSALEAPERLVLRAVESRPSAGRRPRTPTKKPRERSRSGTESVTERRRRPTPRVVGRAVRALSDRPPSARSERPRDREGRPGAIPRDQGARSAAACRPRPHAPSSDPGPRPRPRPSSSRHRKDASRRGADARADSGTRTARAGTRPGGLRATSRWMPRRQALHHRRQRAGEQVGPSCRLQARGRLGTNAASLAGRQC